jgi:hypothetical protein
VSDTQINFPPGKVVPLSASVVSYASRIGEDWRRAAQGMMDVALLCSEASERLSVTEKRQLIQQLPFKEPAFSKFVQIGKDARLHALHARGLLPPHYTIAYLLTRLTGEQLKSAVNEGVINPDMKRADLQGWLKAGRLWLRRDRPAIPDRRGAAVVAAQDEGAFAALEAAWIAAPDLQTAWTNATDAARERFVREVLRGEPDPAGASVAAAAAAAPSDCTRTHDGFIEPLTRYGLNCLGWGDR